MQELRLLFRDPHLVVFEKPAGIQVHPPERERHSRLRVSRRAPDVIRILRHQLETRVFPVHRLDRSTQGVMLMALTSEAASRLQEQFRGRAVRKTYLLVCRGWLPTEGVFHQPLHSDQEEGGLLESRTDFRTLHRFEVPVTDGRFECSRYSLMEARPQTGRFHQIRRHFKSASHPLIGDTVYGDGKHNRIWRTLTSDQRLYLLSWGLEFRHPLTGDVLRFRARFSGIWHRVFDQAGFCPILENQETRDSSV
jgi:tRNA pseudouridine65 synthase